MHQINTVAREMSNMQTLRVIYTILWGIVNIIKSTLYPRSSYERILPLDYFKGEEGEGTDARYRTLCLSLFIKLLIMYSIIPSGHEFCRSPTHIARYVERLCVMSFIIISSTETSVIFTP